MPTALDRLFETEGRAFALPGGETLAAAGEPVLGLYRLDAGRMAEVDTAAPGGFRITAVHRPGALLGAARLLDDSAHDTSLTALRDSNLVMVPVEAVTAALRRDPEILAAVARAALTRLGAVDPEDRRKASILGFVAVCDSVSMHALAQRLAVAMRELGARCIVIGAETLGCSPEALSRMELEHDFVLMAAERQDSAFTAFCGRQIDRLVLVSGLASPLPEGPFTFAAAAIQKHRLLDFILVQPADAAQPLNSDRWLSAAPASRLFQIRDGDGVDLARMARVYTGRSLGLALSGGGARAYAHVGVVRALAEMGVPVDFVGGTSMGAVIAAGVAMNWDVQEMDQRIRDAFVVSSPLSDIAFPLLAMTRGLEVDRRLAKHFGETEISDLWRPFLCVSTDLSTGGAHVHRRGLLRRAIRASLSLPGVLPPVVEDGHVFVDGALVGNLPADLVRDQHDGVTIGVDVAVAEGLKPEDLMLRPSGMRWLTSGAWRRGPPIVSVLIRSATVPTSSAMVATREAADLVIVPRIDGVELRDWKAYVPAVEAGYRATMEAGERIAALMAAP